MGSNGKNKNVDLGMTTEIVGKQVYDGVTGQRILKFFGDIVTKFKLEDKKYINF